MALTNEHEDQGKGAIALWVPCIPAPKGSGRAIPIKTGPVCRVCHVAPTRVGFIVGSADSTKDKMKDAETAIRAHLLAYLHHHPRFDAFVGPVDLELDFYFDRPKSRSREPFHTTYPDIDKLARHVLDCITPKRVKKAPDYDSPHLIRNDSHVCRLTLGKWWANESDGPGIHIHVRSIHETTIHSPMGDPA